MLSRREYIKRIKAHTETIIEDFGVRSLCLFGSVARNEQNESSDIDIFVDMEPDFLKIAGLKQYLE
ncbi:MAG: nucleotidyltransferase domain-containing protein, partial [Bacteroidaceae bacterium]|nr:nucleotidyltransferase domain-containing protein [Bacteroidaceae bacterium]